MQFEYDGETRSVDILDVSLKQSFVIQQTTKDDAHPAGRGLAAWQAGLSEVDPACVRAAYWLMLQQEGTEVPCLSLEFPIVRFSNALMGALIEEQKRQAAEEKAQAEADAAEAAALPTRGRAARYRAPGSRPDGTRELPGGSAETG